MVSWKCLKCIIWCILLHQDIIIIIISSSSSIIIIVFFMQCIYTHIPETNHVPREYIVAAILSLLYMVPRSLVPVFVLLYIYVSTFRSMCAVPNMAVYWHGVLVCCLRIFWIILKWFLSLQLLPVSPSFSHSTCAVFFLWSIYILKSSQLLFNHISVSWNCNTC
jgi:hypothetical protein